MSIDPAGAGARPDQAGQDLLPGGHGERRGGLGAHAAHDQLLVVRFVAGEVSEAEAAAARELLSSCPDCRLLAADLAAISRATADLPAPIRTRDFRISPEDAARLRRSRLRGWLSRLTGGLDGASGRAGAGRLVPLQRLAEAAVAIGLVMAVVTSPVGVPGFTPGAATLPSAGQAVSGREGPASTTRTAPTAAPAAPAAAAPAAAAPASAAGPAAMTAGQSMASGRSLVPQQSAAPAVALSQAPPPAGSAVPAPAGHPPLEAWQVWLLVAAAGLVAFGLLRWRTRAE
ncbi:MAG: hypothetical protein ACP5VP_01820 [Candidatus Limnocylindrales bacterium]